MSSFSELHEFRGTESENLPAAFSSDSRRCELFALDLSIVEELLHRSVHLSLWFENITHFISKTRNALVHDYAPAAPTVLVRSLVQK